jgi:hypothetical protein
MQAIDNKMPLTVGWAGGYIAAGLASTVIPDFSLLEIHEQVFYSLLDMYVFRNGASSAMRGGVGLSM